MLKHALSGALAFQIVKKKIDQKTSGLCDV